jgi:hypothetical protein
MVSAREREELTHYALWASDAVAVGKADRLSSPLVGFLLSYQMLRSPVYLFERVRQQYLKWRRALKVALEAFNFSFL